MMAEITSVDCRILGKFPKAPSNSWSELLTEADRSAYVRIHRVIRSICGQVAALYPGRLEAEIQPSFREASGVRNTRPKDLWGSLINIGSRDLVGMPQIFLIASGRGVEIGFAPAIHRSDFSDPGVKRSLRRVTPLLFELFPDPASAMARQLGAALSGSGRWHFRRKARLLPDEPDDYTSLDGLLTDLRTDSGVERGSAAISRYYSFDDLDNDRLSLLNEMREAAAIFVDLMDYVRSGQRFAIDTADAERHDALTTVDQGKSEGQGHEASSTGRQRILASITRRQGQGRFRVRLLRAYDGACAATKSTTLAILEAAHIIPYDGEPSNEVSNGLLLRSDIHTLFDLGLITVVDGKIDVHESITERLYRALHGTALTLPASTADHPNQQNLRHHRERFRADEVAAAK